MTINENNCPDGNDACGCINPKNAPGNKSKKSIYSHKYYIKNRDKIKAASAAYAAQNKEKVSARHHEYAIKNKERLGEYQRSYYIKNKDKIKAAAVAAYAGKNKEKHLEMMRKNRQRYAEQNARAREMCPAFMFLLQLRMTDIRLYQTRYKIHDNIVNRAIKKCAALQSGDANLCPLVAGDMKNDHVRQQCVIPHVFEFTRAVDRITYFAGKLKKSIAK